MKRASLIRQVTSIDKGWIFRECQDQKTLLSIAMRQKIIVCVKKSGLATFGSTFKKFGGSGGYTICVIIGESSVDIHTWPEYGTVHIRIFYCNFSRDNDAKANKLFVSLRQLFKPKKISIAPIRQFSV